jgi:hypothetical protein
MFNYQKYKLATKFNLYGHPISKAPTRFFADESEEITTEELPNTIDETEEIKPEEIEENEEAVITTEPPAGVQNEVVPPKNDPTTQWPSNWIAGTVHDRCRCVIKTMPGGRKIWEKSNVCCDECEYKARIFNLIQNKLYGV